MEWAREIYSLSQVGLTYTKNEFDIERYKRLQEISAEIIASQSEIQIDTIMESFSMHTGSSNFGKNQAIAVVIPIAIFVPADNSLPLEVKNLRKLARNIPG